MAEKINLELAVSKVKMILRNGDCSAGCNNCPGSAKYDGNQLPCGQNSWSPDKETREENCRNFLQAYTGSTEYELPQQPKDPNEPVKAMVYLLQLILDEQQRARVAMEQVVEILGKEQDGR